MKKSTLAEHLESIAELVKHLHEELKSSCELLYTDAREDEANMIADSIRTRHDATANTVIADVSTPMPNGKTKAILRVTKADPSKAILAYVRANPASRSEDITQATGATKEQVRALVGKGGLRKKGVKRGTRYSVR